jgi:hypothetical protein
MELRAKAAAAGMRRKIIMINISDGSLLRPGADEHHACRLSLE